MNNLFLTVDSMKDKLTHHDKTESLNQHKYSRIANMSYYFENQDFIDETFSYMEELSDFEVDKDLSTEEHSIFHDKNTQETVISYRGTVNKKDMLDDTQIMISKEEKTDRFKKSQEIFDRVSDKYGKKNIIVTGHSLGGGIALHIAEKNGNDVESHVFNPAISAKQTFSTKHHHNKHKQMIYRTKLDPVSIAGEVIGNNQPNREVVTVGNNSKDHAHALTSFFDNDATRNQDGSYNTKKERHHKTVERHQRDFTRMYEAYESSKNIDKFLAEIDSQRQLGLITNIPQSVIKAVELSKNDTDPTEFNNKISESLNPDKAFGFNPDVEYHWDSKTAPDVLVKLGKHMRVHRRVKQDQLMDLEKHKILNYNEDSHDLLYKHNHAPSHTSKHTQLRSHDPQKLTQNTGKRFVEVSGQNLSTYSRSAILDKINDED
jgi:hypothetical protein